MWQPWSPVTWRNVLNLELEQWDALSAVKWTATGAVPSNTWRTNILPEWSPTLASTVMRCSVPETTCMSTYQGFISNENIIYYCKIYKYFMSLFKNKQIKTRGNDFFYNRSSRLVEEKCPVLAADLSRPETLACARYTLVCTQFPRRSQRCNWGRPPRTCW